MAAGRVPDRDDAREVERHARDVARGGRSPRDVLERARPAAAAAPRRRYSTFHAAQPRAARSAAQRRAQVAPVRAPPEAAVESDGHGMRPVAAGQEQLAELRAAPPYAWRSMPRDATRPATRARRAA